MRLTHSRYALDTRHGERILPMPQMA